MKQFLSALIIALAILRSSPANPGENSPPCALSKTEYRGWQAYRLANGIVTLYITPEIGGRAIQYELGSHGFFFVNSELAGQVLPREKNDRGNGWANYGGDKDWLGPQGFDAADQWAGPPDYNIDGSPYGTEVVVEGPEEVAVRVTSMPDERSGLVLSRTYRLQRGSTRILVEHGMENATLRTLRWGFQEVTQSDAADPEAREKANPDLWVYCPLNSRSRFLKGFNPQYGEATHPAYHVFQGALFALHYVYQVAQVGVDSDSGWLAVANGKSGHVYVQRFRYVAGADYPDHCTIEFYLNGPGRQTQLDTAGPTPADPRITPYYLETEIISPYFTLKPGEEASFETEWYAARCPGPILDVTQAGVVNRPLRVSVRADSAWLSGVFGVFFPGAAKISIKSRSGEELEAVSLGSVTPEEVFRLERQIRLPEGAWRLSLIIFDAQGNNRGELGNLTLGEQ